VKPGQHATVMTQEANKEVMRRFHAAWERGDQDALKALLHPDVASYNPVDGTARGIDHELDAVVSWHAGFSNTELRLEHLVAEDDWVAVHWLLLAINDKPFMGMDPTGAAVRCPGFEMNRIHDGRIVEVWRQSDTWSLMQQLGVV
jgi:predicted ester cyclase